MAGQVTAPSAPGFSGLPSQQAYGSAVSPPPPRGSSANHTPADEAAQEAGIHQVIQAEWQSAASQRRLLDENSGGDVWLTYLQAQEVCFDQPLPKALIGWHDTCSPMTSAGLGRMYLQLCGQSNPMCHLGQQLGYLVASDRNGISLTCATNCDVLTQEANDQAQNQSFDEGFSDAMMGLPLAGGAGKMGAAEEAGAAADAAGDAEQLIGDSRSYLDLTKGGSIRNVGTNATRADFADTLSGDGWAVRTSKDGAVQIFEKNGARYVLRSNAGSYSGWTADFYPEGATSP